MQKQITKYFNATASVQSAKPQKTKRDCFIYDPGNRRACFATHPAPDDEFIVKCPKEQITLYIKPTLETKPNVRIPNVCSLPILKSNLQKAVRRFESDVAMASAAAMLYHADGFMELARRLGIIYIEDVCLIDHYTIVVWLMIAASKAYKPTYLDEWILMQIAGDLSRTRDVYQESHEPYENAQKFASIHDIMIDGNNTRVDAVRCVYLRSLYGGMKGDMTMLQNAVCDYAECDCITKNDWDEIERCVPDELEILNVAIDFHPLPHMLSVIEKKTKVSKDRVKELIWNVYSGVNLRKPETISNSQMYAQTRDFAMIESSVATFVDTYLI